MDKTKLRKIILLVLVVTCGFPSQPVGSSSVHESRPPEPITLTEAEILIYLLPQAQEVRRLGMDIGWELQTSPNLNQKDFYVFWVVNAKRPNAQGSVTIGYFDVNKHTAEVWDESTETYVLSQELIGVQGILRRAHQINTETIKPVGHP